MRLYVSNPMSVTQVKLEVSLLGKVNGQVGLFGQVTGQVRDSVRLQVRKNQIWEYQSLGQRLSKPTMLVQRLDKTKLGKIRYQAKLGEAVMLGQGSTCSKVVDDVSVQVGHDQDVELLRVGRHLQVKKADLEFREIAHVFLNVIFNKLNSYICFLTATG